MQTECKQNQDESELVHARSNPKVQKWFRGHYPDQKLIQDENGFLFMLSKRQKCRGKNVLFTKKLVQSNQDEKSVFQYHTADSVGPLVGKSKSLN